MNKSSQISRKTNETDIDIGLKINGIGDLNTELIYDFWDGFAQNAKVNLYIKVENGRNDHHKAEAIFKAVAKAVRMACETDKLASLTVPSTKGVL